ncbi:MAG: DNA-directed RNA polymerase subunit alpha [bacterium]|nr:DNA-directed RNA polymerase subunit alpha [bacterium]
MIMKFQDLVIPNKLKADSKTLTDSYGKFVAEPFEAGYGHTIGNSLRRILLSSMEGSAITAISAKNVFHEYAVIDGITEDMMQIILNLKQVRFKSQIDEMQVLRLYKKGEGVITAADIEENSNIEVVNKDQVIAHLDAAAELDMELYIDRGRGFAPVEEKSNLDLSENVIAIDTVYTPITKVNYYVENARVGNVTDYDRLVMDIKTDGSVKPEDALAYAAKLLKDSMDIFINFEDEQPLIVGYQPEEEEEIVVENTEDSMKNILDESVNVIELSVRSANCLKSAKIASIIELVSKKESELLNYKNFGRKSLEEIKVKLEELGLSLGMDLSSYK